eukprot:CAMPEP_0172198044 /NCGR_PEP_ID=MMETSP1050-20130122/27849_1 /TAXON_ID=233186 /ORGANISM="Cryptomonas curvata, Strain CCAP979/52" /LENGTH=78 /DNA_ID=CAMNT_0012874783 /DNA_START=209 /DNA_END=442 /DNA_ORIENTATION=+
MTIIAGLGQTIEHLTGSKMFAASGHCALACGGAYFRTFSRKRSIPLGGDVCISIPERSSPPKLGLQAGPLKRIRVSVW